MSWFLVNGLLNHEGSNLINGVVPQEAQTWVDYSKCRDSLKKITKAYLSSWTLCLLLYLLAALCWLALFTPPCPVSSAIWPQPKLMVIATSDHGLKPQAQRNLPSFAWLSSTLLQQKGQPSVDGLLFYWQEASVLNEAIHWPEALVMIFGKEKHVIKAEENQAFFSTYPMCLKSYLDADGSLTPAGMNAYWCGVSFCESCLFLGALTLRPTWLVHFHYSSED